MPELPEIEHLKRTLEPVLVGARVLSVNLRRRDVVRSYRTGRRGRVRRTELLEGMNVESLCRHGKNLALVSDAGAVLCVHLGMSGQLRFFGDRQPGSKRDHVHCIWGLRTPHGPGRLVFRDPRRFGGLWTYASMGALREARWSSLGPDALEIKPAALLEVLAGTRRAIKAALLEQSILAGVGNIYADESLFRAGIDPRSVANRIPKSRVKRLAAAIQSVLQAAIAGGGSTIRSYVDGQGNSGGFASRHHVYGRAGSPCSRCGQPLQRIVLAQRGTAFCAACQQLYR